MIKKELKTLKDLRNPTPENRWRIHLEDGTFIDVNGDAERNATLVRLLRNGMLLGEDVRVSQMNGVQNINLSFNVPTIENDEPQEVEKKFFPLLKEELGGWSRESFINRVIMGVIIPFITLIFYYLTDGPIKLNEKETISFLQALPYAIGIGLAVNASLWLTWKAWKLLPFITCWIKIAAFICVFVLVALTVGLISEKIEDQIMGFIGAHTISKRELKILKSTIID